MLDAFLEEEGMVALLRRRVANLEQFRELYLAQESQLQDPTPHASDATVPADTQKILSLERQIQELNGCQSILESELDRLTQENDQLKSASNQSNPPTPQSAEEDGQGETLESLRAEVSQAMEMAFGAMRSNADLGGVIFLLTQSFECSSTEELSKLVLATLGNYQLTGVVAFTHNAKKEYFSSNPEVTEAEKSTLTQIPKDTLLTQTDASLLFHTSYVDFLITSFDSSDFKAFNDLKDTLRMLAIGVNAGARRIISELTAAKERTNLEKLVLTTQKNISGIAIKHKKEVTDVSNLSTELINSVKSHLAKLPGDQNTKESLLETMTKQLCAIEKRVKEASFVDEGFRKVINALATSLSKQK